MTVLLPTHTEQRDALAERTPTCTSASRGPGPAWPTSRAAAAGPASRSPGSTPGPSWTATTWTPRRSSSRGPTRSRRGSATACASTCSTPPRGRPPRAPTTSSSSSRPCTTWRGPWRRWPPCGRWRARTAAPAGEVERALYGFSLFVCLPTGRSETPSAGTGTVMRPATLRRYARDAGFERVDALPIEHEMFRVYRLG